MSGFLADLCGIVGKWENFFNMVPNIHVINLPNLHTAKPLVLSITKFDEAEIFIQSLKHFHVSV
jgi:hypothetical protein